MIKKYQDKEWLYQKRIVEKLSAPKIAKICNCKTSTTIYRWIKKLNIPKLTVEMKIGISIGDKFGRLTIQKRVSNSKYGRTMWLCKCACGKETVVRGRYLRTGTTKSCGCLRRDQMRITFGIASLRQSMNAYKNNAKRKGRKWDITEEQFVEITKKDCYYCGAKPGNITKNFHANGNYTYNGLDRIDSTKGYIIGNIVPCCKTCNIAKHDLTLQEYKDWIKRVYNKMFFKGEDAKNGTS